MEHKSQNTEQMAVANKNSRYGKKTLLLIVFCLAVIAVVAVAGSPKKAVAQTLCGGEGTRAI